MSHCLLVLIGGYFLDRSTKVNYCIILKPEFPILTKNSDFNEDKAVLKDTKIKFKTILCRQAVALTEKDNVFLQINRPAATTKNDL